MKVTVSGKQIDTGDALPAYAEDHIEEVVDKYFHKGSASSITVLRAGSGFRVVISARPGRGNFVQFSGEAETVHPVFDLTLERIATRLRRYKLRLCDHHRKEKSEGKKNPVNMQRYVIAPPSDDEEDAHDEVMGGNPVIISQTTGEIETPSVGEAVMPMDLAGRAAYVFRNAGNGRVNLVHCGCVGKIGWVDPEVSGDAA